MIASYLEQVGHLPFPPFNYRGTRLGVQLRTPAGRSQALASWQAWIEGGHPNAGGADLAVWVEEADDGGGKGSGAS